MIGYEPLRLSLALTAEMELVRTHWGSRVKVPSAARALFGVPFKRKVNQSRGADIKHI